VTSATKCQYKINSNNNNIKSTRIRKTTPALIHYYSQLITTREHILVFEKNEI